MPWTVLNAFGASRTPCRDEDTSVWFGSRSADGVAKTIRQLGYMVTLDHDIEILNTYPYIHPVTVKRYIIVTIMSPDGNYIYGGAEPPYTWGEDEHTGEMSVGACQWSNEELDSMWPLRRSEPRDQIADSDNDWAYGQCRSLELRTIGNTLPPDIVNVLANYERSGFLHEWEFIPGGVMACPVAEMEEVEQEVRANQCGAPCGTCVEKKVYCSSSEDDDG